MPLHPLTHHEILGLIEPFARHGYRADLAASERVDRRLVFLPAEQAGPPPVTETLTLLGRAGGSYRLERHLAMADGPDVRLTADGPDPATLLEWLRRIPVAQAFEIGVGFSVGFSGRIEGPGTGITLTEAVARIGAWRLDVEADPVRGMPADVTLTCTDRQSMTLPEDLLAVLGREWSLLRKARTGWAASVRLPRRAHARDAATRRLVVAAGAHLAATFRASPEAFHAMHVRARWRVAARRVLPLAAALLLIVAGAACTRLDISNDATLRVLLMSSPPLLMILFFSLREVPRLELPPAPRPANAGRWPTHSTN